MDKLRLWHVYLFNSVMFMAWGVFQMVSGHSYYALAFDVIAAGCYLWLAHSRRKREIKS
jgi:hypothetical protein